MPQPLGDGHFPQASHRNPSPKQKPVRRRAWCLFHFAGCQDMCNAPCDWLRHMTTHLRFYSFRCQFCFGKVQSTSKIWSEQNFRGHLQRYHKDQAADWEQLVISGRVPEREPPERLDCCSHVFRGSGAWEQYADHVWKVHLRPPKKCDPVPVIVPDKSLIQYAVKCGIIDDHGDSVYKLVQVNRRSPGSSTAASRPFNSKKPSEDPVRFPIETPFDSGSAQ